MKNTLPTYARYKRDYETAKSLGAAALACNAVLIPTGFEHMRLLFQNFTRPMVTNNDPADVDYAGGLAAHIQGVPKTDFETSVTAIETEKGALSKFAQAVVDNGGMLPECRLFLVVVTALHRLVQRFTPLKMWHSLFQTVAVKLTPQVVRKF